METAPIPNNTWHRNGTVAPTLPPELADWPPMLEAVMEQTRQQLHARDLSEQQHTWYWHRFALWVSGLLGLAVLAIVWLAWQRSHVQAFVQVVQETEDGRLVQIGVPKRLLDYTPAEGAWQDMLAEWLRRVYWRGEDTAKADKVDWRWAELHTCPSARPFLVALKEQRQPGKKTATRAQITIKSITKTPTPQSYQVLWEEILSGPEAPRGKTVLRTTTFTVGRINVTTLHEAEDNRLGLCVASFDTSAQTPN